MQSRKEGPIYAWSWGHQLGHRASSACSFSAWSSLQSVCTLFVQPLQGPRTWGCLAEHGGFGGAGRDIILQSRVWGMESAGLVVGAKRRKCLCRRTEPLDMVNRVDS